MLTRRIPISIAEAQAKIAAIQLPTATETIAVQEANHRILAQAAQAPYDYPHFRRSGVDGYAVNPSDEANFPGELRVVGEVPAGATWEPPLQAGETVRIMTGAAVPKEASKVIMIEKTRPHPDRGTVTIMAGENHSNITEVGTDFRAGDVVLAADQELNPGGIALLIAMGIQEVTVYRQPRIAILATGSELLAPGQPIQAGKIYNSNGPMLAQLVAESGGQPTLLPQLPDQPQAIQAALQAAIKDYDLVITDGGVSVGDYDFLGDAARHADQLLFNKIKQRPGSVTTAFVQDDTLVFALSGNPGACFVGFYLYVEPAIRRYQHQSSRLVPLQARLAAPYTKTNGFDRILRCTYQFNAHEFLVYPNGTDRSGSLANLQTTTCFCLIPHSQTPIALNAEVQAWLLPFK